MLPTYSSKKFTYNKESRSFTTRASMLGRVYQAILGRVLNDSCDFGFRMVNEKTGDIVAFVIWEEIHDCEDNLRYITLRPNPMSVRKNPRLEGVTVIVWND